MKNITKYAKQVVSNRLYLEKECALKTAGEKMVENPKRTDIKMWLDIAQLYCELLNQVENMTVAD